MELVRVFLGEKRNLLLAAAVVLLLFLLIWNFWGSDQDPIPVAPQAVPSARAAQPVAGTKDAATNSIVTEVDLAAKGPRPADCLIEPSQVVKVNSAVEGIIGGIAVDRGQFVHRGQVVAQLRSEVENSALAVARAKAANVYSVNAARSKSEYLGAKQERNQQLQRYLARDTVEEASSNAQTAAQQTQEAALMHRVAQLEAVQSERLVAERTVRSPIDGVVVERAMSPGEYRGADSDQILTIARIDPLFVEVFAPISQLNTVKVGDMANVMPEDPVGGRYEARIIVIDKVFDAASGTFGMRLQLPNPGNKLPAGLRCRVEFKA